MYLEPDELDECSLFALQLYQVWVYTRYTSDGLAFLVLLTPSALDYKSKHTIQYVIPYTSSLHVSRPWPVSSHQLA